MKTMCPPGYHHNGNPCTWAHDVQFIKNDIYAFSRYHQEGKNQQF